MDLFSPKTSLMQSGSLQGMTDWHSHLLPGVDDGVQTMADTLKILRLYERAGFKTVWVTPHIMEEVPNTTDDLRSRFEELKAQYQGPIELHLAAENMMDTLLEERLENNDVLPIGVDQRHLLVETSYFSPPVNMLQIIRRIKSKGYFPVLAHPERYIYMSARDYAGWKDEGVLFQMNIFSLTNAYGDTARKKAVKMLKEGMYDLFGTDTHSYRGAEAMIWSKDIRKSYLKHIDQKTL